MGSLIKIILGAYFLIPGSALVVFHKALTRLFEDVYGGMAVGGRLLPGGRSLTFMIILTGVFSVIGGLTLLVMYFR
jgi:hypothetical protein